jgi:hypothetical protein
LLLQTRRRSDSPLLNTKAMVDRSSNIDVKQEEWGPDGGRDEEGKDASMENLSGVCMTKPNKIRYFICFLNFLHCVPASRNYAYNESFRSAGTTVPVVHGLAVRNCNSWNNI